MKTIVVLLTLLSAFSASAASETMSCAGQDLKISLVRSIPEFASNFNPEGATLLVSCKDGEQLRLVIGEPEKRTLLTGTSYGTEGYLATLVSNFETFFSTFQKRETENYKTDLLKSYLATLLTAKTAKLPVTVTFDRKSLANFTSGPMSLLGVTVE